jgi:hypothetical protein
LVARSHDTFVTLSADPCVPGGEHKHIEIASWGSNPARPVVSYPTVTVGFEGIGGSAGLEGSEIGGVGGSAGLTRSREVGAVRTGRDQLRDSALRRGDRVAASVLVAIAVVMVVVAAGGPTSENLNVKGTLTGR